MAAALLVAWCDVGTDTRQRLSAFGNDGKGRHLSAAAYVPCTQWYTTMAEWIDGFRAGDNAGRRIFGPAPTRPESGSGLFDGQPIRGAGSINRFTRRRWINSGADWHRSSQPV